MWKPFEAFSFTGVFDFKYSIGFLTSPPILEGSVRFWARRIMREPSFKEVAWIKSRHLIPSMSRNTGRKQKVLLKMENTSFPVERSDVSVAGNSPSFPEKKERSASFPRSPKWFSGVLQTIQTRVF